MLMCTTTILLIFEFVKVMQYLLTSESSIKINVVKSILCDSDGIDVICKGEDCIDIGNVSQPVGVGGLVCCKNRILKALSMELGDNITAIISIENSIEKITNQNSPVYIDVVNVLIYDVVKDVYIYECGYPVPFDGKYWDMAYSNSLITNELGWSYTVGEVMKNEGVTTNHKNWMLDLAGLDRSKQITDVFKRCWDRYFGGGKLVSGDLMGNIDFYLGFKRGVVFQDLGSIMSKRVLFDMLMCESEKVLRLSGMDKIDYIIGIEARGFYIGPLLAERFACGFVPIRKKDKLPGKVVSISYSTEYSFDSMEISLDLIKEGSRVLLVDDLVATGGSLEAACRLVSKKATVVGCFCPLRVSELVGQANDKLRVMGIKLVTL